MGFMSLDPGNLRAKPGDSLVQFIDGHWVEIFLAELHDRLAGLEIILLVHGTQR